MNVHQIRPDLLSKRIKVVLVGAGGTGSHVLRRLANIHLAMMELGHPYGLDVTVIDPDTVSRSNVGRQNFYLSDVGKSKAEILVNRCNMLMQTNWEASQQRVTNQTRMMDVDIAIGCVDNRKGRAAILSALSKSTYKPTYWLDIGNRAHDGQVILGQVYPDKEDQTGRLPHVVDLFPEIADESLEAEDDTPSCSLAEALEKQSLFINDTMANMACNILWDLFRHGQIKHHGQFVNIKSGRATPLAIDPEAWKRFGYDASAAAKRKRRRKAA